MVKRRVVTCVALVAFAICAFPVTGAATTYSNAQVSYQVDTPSCWGTAYGTLTNQSCSNDTIFLWPTTQARNGYYNVSVQVYNDSSINPVECNAVATYSGGGVYYNGWQYTGGSGYQTISMTGSSDVYIGTAALYIECTTPEYSSVIAWAID